LDTISSLSSADIYIIVTGIIMGTIARLICLKIDSRQIPSYPTAYFNNIILGFVASTLGAVAIPALLAKDYVAVTFLTIAAQQFREVRSAEMKSLAELEKTEYTKRGAAYIDGISKTFESRNYISLITALASVMIMKIIPSKNMLLLIFCGAVVGFLVMFYIYRFTKGKTVGDICTVKVADFQIKGSELYVEGMFVTNYLGTEQSREFFTREGIAIILTPKDQIARITLENFGQRQAILFEAIRTAGVKKYRFFRRDFSKGHVIIAFIPIVKDTENLLNAIRLTPVLENSQKLGKKMKTMGGQK
jgi:uncharacterized membrane protein YeaQ/YmgE (transglycosylase-associated protein family)